MEMESGNGADVLSGLSDMNGNVIAGGGTGLFDFTAQLYFRGQNITMLNFHLLDDETRKQFFQKLAMTILDTESLFNMSFSMPPTLRAWTLLLVRTILLRLF